MLASIQSHYRAIEIWYKAECGRRGILNFRFSGLIILLNRFCYQYVLKTETLCEIFYSYADDELNLAALIQHNFLHSGNVCLLL
jgi:hypothetical protein